MAQTVSASQVPPDPEEDGPRSGEDLAADPWGSTILLVEDNPRDARTVRRILRQESSDYHIHHVRRLECALDALQSQEFGVVLLDLQLPDGKGIETLREVAAAAPTAPIVVLTGLTDQSVALQALQAGAQDFLSKARLDDGVLLKSMRFAIERKRSETRLAYLAHHDPLTGLSNRAFFREQLGLALDRVLRSTDRTIGVLFLDLDRFKQVNDTFGHDVGDQLLIQVARRLRRCVRSFEPVARLGGDEFVVFIESTDGSSSAEKVAQRVLTALEPPFFIGGVEREVSTSIGVAMSLSEDTVDRILERADEAMYRAKRAGRNKVFVAAKPSADGEFSLSVNEVERALVNDELEVLYQPKLDLSSGEINGVEALLRWNHPRRGALSPGELLPLLESTGLVVPIGDWVLRRACAQARRFALRSGGPRIQNRGSSLSLRLAVNVSAEQFDREGLADTVSDVLSQTGFPAACLEVEVREEVLLRDVPRSKEVLSALGDLGVRISLDDFNAHSSLTDLARFPLDVIKLDRSLVCDIAESPAHRAVVVGVVNFARNLGVETVAEGVETPAETASLRQMGCGSIQGFHVCGPMDAVSLTVWLSAREAEL